MALLDASNMEHLKTENLFDDYQCVGDATEWLENAINDETVSEDGMLDIKVHDIWQGALMPSSASSAAAAGLAAQAGGACPDAADLAGMDWAAYTALAPGSVCSSSGSSTASASPRSSDEAIDADFASMMMNGGGDFADFDLPDVDSDSMADDMAILSDLGLETASAMTSGMMSESSAIRDDLMLSSTLSFLDSGNTSRQRNISLTLSECADNLFKELDLLGTSPNSASSILSCFETPLPSEGSDPEATEDEEEIEVVDNSDSKHSSSNKLMTHSSSAVTQISKKSSHHHYRHHHVQAGRSLLRKNHKRIPSEASATTYEQPRPSTSILESTQLDHCYYATSEIPSSSPAMHGASKNSNGLLTPNESSDDDDRLTSRSSKTNPNSLLGKRKHEDGSSSNDSATSLKFKFRMKFGSSYSPQRRSLMDKKEDDKSQRQGSKRKSAMKNAHCPSPVKSSSGSESDSPMARSMSPPPTRASIKALRKSGGGASSPALGETQTEQKCRELRDLHNSMERARRVDLKVNFDQLKDKVPELRDVEKASKMVILNKASDYTRQLEKTDLVLTAERERTLRRNAELRQRLQMAMRALAGGSGGAGNSNRRLNGSSRLY
jgi:hypothetical protein